MTPRRRKAAPPASFKLSVLEFLMLFFTIAALVVVQATMFGADLLRDSGGFLPWYLLYWGVVSAGVTLTIDYFRSQMVDEPIRELSRAIREVAGGDFSVYLKPPNTSDQWGEIDVMYDDFNKMVAELGSIETMKTDFISNVSHEIKTPLAVISNYAQILKAGGLSAEEQQEYLDGILSNSHRLADLVTNILKLNKIENQVIQPVAAPYDLCAQLSECALLFEDAWEKKDLDFCFEVQDRAVVCADREMLDIVWNNLLSNAIKFTPEGGTVSLIQTAEPDALVVSVSDTGCGMDAATMEHIFEKFYQGDTSHATQGNGLGLALTLRILQITGGTITVDSAPGKGSTFTVRLPLQKKEEETV